MEVARYHKAVAIFLPLLAAESPAGSDCFKFLNERMEPAGWVSSAIKLEDDQLTCRRD